MLENRLPGTSAEPYLFVIEITVITKYLADAEADPGEFCRAGQTA
jgi:hypothetical protein